MKTDRLIQLAKNHYIIIDDSEIKEGDWYYFEGLHGLNASIHTLKVFDNLGRGCFKITHSTEPLEQYYGTKDGIIPFVYHKIKPLSLSDIEEAIYGYSVEKMAKDAYVKHSVKDDSLSLDEQIQRTGGFNVGYSEGFNAHKELTKDKLFTIEDMRKAIEMASGERLIDKELQINLIIHSLLPQTEWNCTFDENNKIKLI